jgi:uncharacterized protein
MPPWGRFVLVYGAIAGAGAAALVAWRGGSLVVVERSWLPLSGAERHLYSACAGVVLGAATALTTRWTVRRFAWARDLHGALRPVARQLGVVGALLVALSSALGEELWFRGLLMPVVGLVPQALVFGLVHQLRGKARWAWVAWATSMGLALGALVQLTGSLVGAVVAHALVNFCNLLFLQQHDPTARPRALGGLLGQRG